MIETYSFTIPSLQDDLPLDCRIYHPEHLQSSIDGRGGAIIAHPYAPLGGSQNDHVVLALTQCLLEAGHIVVTFNFRGAGGSAGNSSWTGHGETQDYISVFGLLVYYLHHLNSSSSKDERAALSPVLSIRQPGFSEEVPFEASEPISRPMNILLGGYSFGSLILVRLPSIATMINTFETAERGTAGAEIFLRARALARQTQRLLQESQPPATPSSRKHTPSHRHSRSSPITIGGEETDPSKRRRSKSSRRRSMSSVRDMPQRIRSQIRRNSGSSHHQRDDAQDHQSPGTRQIAPRVKVRYLLVSPVLFPLSTVLLPPGLALSRAKATDANVGVLSLKSPTFVAFGDSDHFTSAKKLRQWSERLAAGSAGRWKWIQVDGAGHFWREDGAAARLEAELVKWMQTDLS
ncbi:uncharacterized protein RCC_06457 [Ramularia collo-cygni]|uniref:AB hydrolase-1 domain-containing protein n=1 Tax=Ramularia collo-cygni TaxID=112498 RepID=A0A2D3VFK6_9PEZI|nr:uncharacterized protein RCC_06457 [Ramularia collo-cygni]CZT20599.1 uncharacterized protein RCC_06457 [Ramularia collo-cygni]